MTFEQYNWAVARIKAIQTFRVDHPEVTPGMRDEYELETLMKDVQDYEDACDLEVIRELEEREAIADRLLEMEAWTR